MGRENGFRKRDVVLCDGCWNIKLNVCKDKNGLS